MIRMTFSGGYTQRSGGAIRHWSGSQVSMALSSGEAELSIVANGISEVIGVLNMHREVFGVDRDAVLCVDASA